MSKKGCRAVARNIMACGRKAKVQNELRLAKIPQRQEDELING